MAFKQRVNQARWRLLLKPMQPLYSQPMLPLRLLCICDREAKKIIASSSCMFQSNPIPAVRNWRRAAVLIVMMIIIARFGSALIMIEAGDLPRLLGKLHAFFLFLVTVRKSCVIL